MAIKEVESSLKDFFETGDYSSKNIVKKRFAGAVQKVTFTKY